MALFSASSSTARRFFGRPFGAFVLRPFLTLLLGIAISHLAGNSRITRPAGFAATQAHGHAAGELTPERPAARELPGGSSHSYELKLDAGQYARALIDKGDLGLSATVFGPDGGRLAEFVSRRYAPLRVTLIAVSSGPHHLEVRSLEPEGASGHYELTLEEVRGATAQDVRDERADKLFAEAETLRARWEGQSFREALKRYAEAWKQRQAGAQPRLAAESLEASGEVYLNLGEHAAALDSFEQARAASRAARDARGEMRALNGIGRVHVFLGKNAQVLASADKVLAHARRFPARDGEDLRREALALNNRGEALYSQGALKNARADFERALGLWARARDRAGQALAHLNLGYTYADSGDLEKADGHLQQSLTLCRAIDDRRGEARARAAVGAVNSFLGERQSALDSHKQALQIFRAIGDRQGEAVALNSVGQVYEDLSEPRTALDHYRLALELFQENGSRDFEAVTLYCIGRVFRTLGDYEQALANYRRSLSLSRALGKQRIEAYAFTDISLTYNSLGRQRAALGQFNEVLKVYRRAGDRRGQANTLKNMGDIHRSLGEPRRAEDCYVRALSFSRQAGDRGGEASTLYDLARVELDAGRLDEALRHVAGSIDIIEALRTQVASPQLRASYFASVHKHFGLYITLLMRMHKLRPADGHAAEALRASERARARTLLEILPEAGARLRQGVDPALLERERSLQQRLNAKAMYRMRLLNSPTTEAGAEEAEQGIRQLADEYQEVQTRIRTQSPRYAGLTQPPTLRLEEIQSELLDADTILLEYALGDEQSYLWAVTTDAVTTYELPARSEIEEAAREVYRLLTARQSEDTSFADYQERVIAADEQYRLRAAALSRMVLGQVAHQLGGKRLLIVADGALQYIPFEALPAPPAHAPLETPSPADAEAGADGAPPLVLRHEIAYLPSASVLALLRRDKADKVPAPGVVLVLADPVFGGDDARARRSGDAPPAAAPLPLVPPALFRDAAAGRSRSIPRLPSTRDEAEAIVDAAPRGRGKLATGFAASRATVTGDEPGRYRIVHFATHGVIDSEHPELSGILLSLVNVGGGQENGFLQLHDIYNLRLSADLVVLSSCSTALGKEMKGEGLVGLTRGFMYAGADGVVASLWQVDDKASAELMKHFYRGMLQDGLAPAAALKTAKEKMWRQRRWRSPFYWAAFVLQGEYRQRVRDEQSVRLAAFTTPAAGAAATAAALLLVLSLLLRKRFPTLRRAPK